MPSPEPVDPELYAKVKMEVYAEHEKHSAYRSGILVQRYKARFAEKHGARKKPYKGTKPTKKQKGLKRWFAEDWRNESGEIGYDKKNTLYRPKNRVTKDTPTTWGELTPAEIKAAKKEKKTKGRVKRFTNPE